MRDLFSCSEDVILLLFFLAQISGMPVRTGNYAKTSRDDCTLQDKRACMGDPLVVDGQTITI